MDRWLANSLLELEQKASLCCLLTYCSSDFVEFLNRLFTPPLAKLGPFRWRACTEEDAILVASPLVASGAAPPRQLDGRGARGVLLTVDRDGQPRFGVQAAPGVGVRPEVGAWVVAPHSPPNGGEVGEAVPCRPVCVWRTAPVVRRQEGGAWKAIGRGAHLELELGRERGDCGAYGSAGARGVPRAGECGSEGNPSEQLLSVCFSCRD